MSNDPLTNTQDCHDENGGKTTNTGTISTSDQLILIPNARATECPYIPIGNHQ